MKRNDLVRVYCKAKKCTWKNALTALKGKSQQEVFDLLQINLFGVKYDLTKAKY